MTTSRSRPSRARAAVTLFAMAVAIGTVIHIPSFTSILERGKRIGRMATASKGSKGPPSDLPRKNQWPEISWLVSYPDSGTKEFLRFVQDMSKTTTATNYGYVSDAKLTISVKPSKNIARSLNGPYRTTSYLPFPTKYILTDTHCYYHGGDDLPNMLGVGWYEFYMGCSTGNFYDAGIENTGRYNPGVVNKLVYMIRDPFENIIDRFYAERDGTTTDGDGVDGESVGYSSFAFEAAESRTVERMSDYSNARMSGGYSNARMSGGFSNARMSGGYSNARMSGGYSNARMAKTPPPTPSPTTAEPTASPTDHPRRAFVEWCNAHSRRTSSRGAGMFLAKHMPAVGAKVPCQAMFFQYVSWHNGVADLIGSLGWRIEHLALYFEDLTADVDGVRDSIFEFLELSTAGVPAGSFTHRHSHTGFFTEEELTAISSLIKVVASRDTWLTLERYLPYPKYQLDYKYVGERLAPETHGKWPDLAWLISFPHSGGTFTNLVMEKVTRQTVATNYAIEVGELYYEIPNPDFSSEGPYRRSPRPFPEQYVLTESHCAYCLFCNPKQKIEFGEFVQECSHTKKFEGTSAVGQIAHGNYDPKAVKKIVHLVRNPYNVLVGTFQFEHQKANNRPDTSFEYSYSPMGYRQWCYELDSKFSAVEAFPSRAIADLTEDIPCFGILFQMVQWHNNAVRLSKELGIPSLNVYYEDYLFDMEGNLNKMTNFLQLPRSENVDAMAFIEDPDQYTKMNYNNIYFTLKERNAVARFIAATADPDVYDMIRRYFPDDTM
eukprot:CAMPEP_0172520628 /NCGR_PEP_ID=MMETSP1066-20121228/292115_1 /TAXON_ID=671091 /ORGANISM="Coscinodiscus wailesii, Strain CCMP2513" /LENGTH=774 /DNA_ID=CAMNT_0013303421 /DNA_START=49 /DNA_END=2373 /DNA_ORIENTATION=-